MSADRDLEVAAVAQDAGAVSAPVPAEVPLIMALQRSAGNAAVGRLLRATPGESRRGLVAPSGTAAVRALQRYEAFEHAKQSDAVAGSLTINVTGSSITRGGVLTGTNSLTTGEINALADLYARPEDLWKADAVELAKLKVLIKRQLAGEKVQESEWDDATGGRYNRLNLRNAAHFAPRNAAIIKPTDGTSAVSDNKDRFKNYYSEAIINARIAWAGNMGLGPPSAEDKQKYLDQSAIAAGFAEHYLMDAFSAGHLFNKDDFIAALTTNLNALTKDELSNLFGAVADGVLADPTSRALLGRYEPTDRKLILAGWRPNFDRKFAFKALLENLYEDAEGKQAVYSALVKVAHDEFSTRKNDGGGTNKIGIPVENDAGDKWILSGDKTLDTSPRTQEVIAKAITEFRKQIKPYREGWEGPGGFAPGSEKVMVYFPRPTSESITYMSGRIKQITDAHQGTINALVAVMIRELPSILSALVDRGRIKLA